jgi:predicted nucleotidyltransferase
MTTADTSDLDPAGPVNPAPTQFPELNSLLVDLVQQARLILEETFVGAYLQGSFAVGDADLHSDCDFLIPISAHPGPRREALLRTLHDRIPTRPGHWSQHLEGSYPLAPELRTTKDLSARWLFVDHGSRTLAWSDHCNNPWARWSLRERGVTLVGPPPATLVDPVAPGVMRAAALATLPTLVEDIHSWMSPTIAWGQRYIVASAARALYTATTAEVASKARALRWARTIVDERWHQLIDQVLADRDLGFDPDHPPRPGSLAAAHGFAAYVARLGEDLDARR